jgi:hypothetical protein
VLRKAGTRQRVASREERIREALSTNIWPPLESCVWRPGVVSADDHLKSRRGHVELDGKWDLDPSREILLDVLQSEADFFDKLSCPYCEDKQEEFVDQEQLQSHLKERHCNEHRCHHCREEFVDKTRLEANYTETGHLQSLETPDDELPDFEEVKCSLEVCSGRGDVVVVLKSPGQTDIDGAKKTDCRKCLVSTHFSRTCDECRPRHGCFTCGDPGHIQKGCPFGPAFGLKGEAGATFSEAFARWRSSWRRAELTGSLLGIWTGA